MTDIEPADGAVGRRNFLVRAIVAIQATIGATLAFVLGATTLAPSFTRREPFWLHAAELESLPENQPVPVTLRDHASGRLLAGRRSHGRLSRPHRRARRAGDAVDLHAPRLPHGVRPPSRSASSARATAASSTSQGNVVDGPPPAPLPTLTTKVDNGQVLVQV